MDVVHGRTSEFLVLKTSEKNNLTVLLVTSCKIFQHEMIEQQKNALKRVASETLNSAVIFPLTSMDSKSDP